MSIFEEAGQGFIQAMERPIIWVYLLLFGLVISVEFIRWQVQIKPLNAIIFVATLNLGLYLA